MPLGEALQPGGKVVQAWAIEGDWDPGLIQSKTFEIEWPPRSGRRRTFPGIDRAAWFGIADARRKIPKGQMVFVDRLLESAMAVCHDNRQYRPDTTDTGPTMFDLMFLGTSARVPSAVLAKAGKQVTVLEALDRVLARVSGAVLSRFYEAEHRAHGVDVRLGATVDFIEGRDGRVTSVRLADGEIVSAELVIVGIGIIPAVDPLRAAGADCSNGVSVDEFGHTTLPDIWAIGDCALHSNSFAESPPIRLESVQNATDMAITVAKAITGAPAPYRNVPWFWSNQYDLKLQTIGPSAGYDREIVRGDPVARSFSVVYLKKGRVIALDCVNSPKDYVQRRRIVVEQAAIDPSRLAADPIVSLGKVETGQHLR